MIHTNQILKQLSIIRGKNFINVMQGQGVCKLGDFVIYEKATHRPLLVHDPIYSRGTCSSRYTINFENVIV